MNLGWHALKTRVSLKINLVITQCISYLMNSTREYFHCWNMAYNYKIITFTLAFASGIFNLDSAITVVIVIQTPL